MAKAEGLHIDVDEVDWNLLAGMGTGAVGGVGDSGISNYQDAAAACSVLSAIGAASGAKYGLDDLVCFLCLSKHMEAVETESFPPLAPPVSISVDLDLELPQPLVRRPPRLRTGWKKLDLKPLSRKPNLGDAMLELIRWPHIAAASSLSMCCRAFHGHGFFMACRRYALPRFSYIADSVAFQLSPEEPVAAALLNAGATKSTLLRTVACALNWLEKCSLWRDANLMIVALLRFSINFEVNAEHQQYGLELIGLETEAVSAIECLLVTQLWGASSR